MHQLENDNALSTFASYKKVPKIDHFWTAVSFSFYLYADLFGASTSSPG